MPLEGHYERQTTPLYKLSSTRDQGRLRHPRRDPGRAARGGPAARSATADPAPPRAASSPQVAGIVGAETISACGQEAVEICTRAAEFKGARAETIVGDCETQGVKF